jgi:hypothetical protein
MPIQILEVSNDLLETDIDPDVYQVPKCFIISEIQNCNAVLRSVRSIRWQSNTIVFQEATPRDLAIPSEQKSFTKPFKMKFEITILIAFLASGLPLCSAWGNMGHEAVAYIATNFGGIHVSAFLFDFTLDHIP